MYNNMEYNSVDENDTLLHDRAVKLSKAKVHVNSDSVLCLGKIHEYPQSVGAWEQEVGWFTKSLEYHEFYPKIKKLVFRILLEKRCMQTKNLE